MSEGVLTPAAHDVQDTAIHGLKHRKSATASVASVLGDAPNTPRGDAHRARSGAFGNRYEKDRLELSAPYNANRLPARSTLTW